MRNGRNRKKVVRLQCCLCDEKIGTTNTCWHPIGFLLRYRAISTIVKSVEPQYTQASRATCCAEDWPLPGFEATRAFEAMSNAISFNPSWIMVREKNDIDS